MKQKTYYLYYTFKKYINTGYESFSFLLHLMANASAYESELNVCLICVKKETIGYLWTGNTRGRRQRMTCNLGLQSEQSRDVYISCISRILPIRPADCRGIVKLYELMNPLHLCDHDLPLDVGFFCIHQ